MLYPPGWKPRLYGRQYARRHSRCSPADTAAARSGDVFGKNAQCSGKSSQCEPPWGLGGIEPMFGQQIQLQTRGRKDPQSAGFQTGWTNDVATRADLEIHDTPDLETKSHESVNLRD
jgi:hypothetical protein